MSNRPPPVSVTTLDGKRATVVEVNRKGIIQLALELPVKIFARTIELPPASAIEIAMILTAPDHADAITTVNGGDMVIDRYYAPAVGNVVAFRFTAPSFEAIHDQAGANAIASALINLAHTTA